MDNLKDYMLLFRMELNPNAQPTVEQLNEIKKSWSTWIGGIAQNARLVSSHQLGFEGNMILADKSMNSGVVTQNKESVSGNLVLKATSLDEATEMAKGCPILIAGGSVEVRSTLNIF